jgi:hypothetical protein
VNASPQLALFEPEAAPGAAPARTVRDRAALRPQPTRNGDDWWATPTCLTTALVRFVLPEVHGVVWECAAGDGALAAAMRAAGRDVLATDLFLRAPDIARLDFLHDDPPLEAHGRAIVTNPPFRLQDRFRTRGLQLLDRGVASALVLLMRNDALTADCRAEALNRASAEWACSWRPVWLPGTKGGGRWSNSWVLFRPGVANQTVVRRLRRQDIAP